MNLTYDEDEPPDDPTTEIAQMQGSTAVSASIVTAVLTSADVDHVIPERFKQTMLFSPDEPRNPVKLAKPPKFIWSWLDGRLISPTQYRKLCEPHIADMHAQYFECISKGDESGARWAVIRGNLYAVPSWAWGVALTVLGWLKHWLSTA